MVRLSVVIIFVLVTVGRADWPQWRGPNRDGIWTDANLPEKFPAKLEARWRKPVGGGFSGIAVVRGRGYAFDYQKKPKELERIHCLDAKTGETLWTHSYDVAYQKLDYGNGP